LDTLATIDRDGVRAIITRSLTRLQVDRLDLVQFHWWNYDSPRWVEVALMLAELQREGLIRHLGATNFNPDATLAMVDAGVALRSMQVQYSLLDRRPAGRMAEVAATTGLQFLCYGALAGGFLSRAWLGVAEPTEISNRSQVKYKLVIDDVGGWAWFQALLGVLDTIAQKHGVSIANVATRWVLDRPYVAGAIVGARHEDHLADTLGVFGFSFDAMDRMAIDAVLAESRAIAGEVYDAERDRTGRHGRIMKYSLNADPNAKVG
jgi:aryl-alcohol dehydrogenase-like predicted oxidoreductase